MERYENSIPMSAYSHGTDDGVQGFRAKHVPYRQTAWMWNSWLYLEFG